MSEGNKIIQLTDDDSSEKLKGGMLWVVRKLVESPSEMQ